MVTSGTMTNRVDPLLGRGFVERHPDPHDRRGVIVRLTPSGRAAVDAALDDLLAHERAILAALDESERAGLVGLLRTLSRPLETA